MFLLGSARSAAFTGVDLVISFDVGVHLVWYSWLGDHDLLVLLPHAVLRILSIIVPANDQPLDIALYGKS